MLVPEVQVSMEKSSRVLCVNFNTTTTKIPSNVVIFPKGNTSSKNFLHCSQVIGYLAVYRIFFGLAIYFSSMMILTYFVGCQKTIRHGLQNGFWSIKWIVVILVICCIFFIPDGQNLVFSKIVFGLGLFFSIIFIVLQIIFIVDLIHKVADWLLKKVDGNENTWWRYLPILLMTVLLYIISVVGISLMYAFFIDLKVNNCHLNKFFISMTLIFGVVVSIVAILPCVQKVQPKSGIFQAASVSLYCTYYTWSAISSEPYGPDNDCHLKETTIATYSYNGNALAASIIGGLIFLFTSLWVCFQLSKATLCKNLFGASENNGGDDQGSCMRKICLGYLEPATGNGADNGSAHSDSKCYVPTIVDDEESGAVYIYPIFHFIMLLSVFYLMMLLTNWAIPGNTESKLFQNTWVSVWFKIVTVWICYGVYLWILVAPFVLRKWRNFDSYQEEN